MLKYRPSTVFLFLNSICISVICLWWISHKWSSMSSEVPENVTVVKNQSEVLSYFGIADNASFFRNKETFYIPTGYFIKSISFLNSTDYNVTGYIWQKYPKHYPKEFQKGIVFAEEMNANRRTIELIYQDEGEQNGVSYEVMGWFFDVSMRQAFDYSKYPLDAHSVSIRLWPKEFENDSQVILVPDFQAYTDANKNLFGLDMNIINNEWDIEETYFSYRKIRYDTDFGFFDFVSAADYKPHLYSEFFVNLKLQRRFMNAFIINLVPLFVVVLLLFGHIMTITSDENKMKRLNFSTQHLFSACSGLFFVVVLAHIQVRRLFSGAELVYLEYFYLMAYLLIILTALNTYIFRVLHLRLFSLIHYRDNIIVKFMFWPFIFLFIALVTKYRL